MGWEGGWRRGLDGMGFGNSGRDVMDGKGMKMRRRREGKGHRDKTHSLRVFNSHPFLPSLSLSKLAQRSKPPTLVFYIFNLAVPSQKSCT